MELLPAIVGLAVVDSINPSALLATVALLLRGRRARPLVVVYVAAVLLTYFAIGLALTLGLGLTPEALIQSDAAYLAQGLLGAAMLAYAVLAPGRGRERAPTGPRRLPAAGRPAAVFALGMAVTVLELPTAFPYLGAAGAIVRADLGVGEWLPLLATYNLIFVLPPLVLLAGHVALGDRAVALLERLRDRLGGAAREGLLWLLGLVGFFLLADALRHFGVIGA
jgi:threonine/homoserine/homoserine lactone efflux protein